MLVYFLESGGIIICMISSGLMFISIINNRYVVISLVVILMFIELSYFKYKNFNLIIVGSIKWIVVSVSFILNWF